MKLFPAFHERYAGALHGLHCVELSSFPELAGEMHSSIIGDGIVKERVAWCSGTQSAESVAVDND